MAGLSALPGRVAREGAQVTRLQAVAILMVGAAVMVATNGIAFGVEGAFSTCTGCICGFFIGVNVK